MARKGGKDRGLFEHPTGSGSGGFDIGTQTGASTPKRLGRRRYAIDKTVFAALAKAPRRPAVYGASSQHVWLAWKLVGEAHYRSRCLPSKVDPFRGEPYQLDS
jgi:hypothetical protein